MPLNDKLAFKLTVSELPSVSQQDMDALLDYLVNALGLASNRSNAVLARQLLRLFMLASEKKNGFIDSGIQELEVIDSGLRANDILNWLKAHETGIGASQLYNNYLNAFIKAGLIVKRKHSAYGLKAESFYATLKETELNLNKEFNKVLEHAKKLDVFFKK